MKPVVAILAGTFQEFREFANAHPEINAVFCGSCHMFNGIEFSHFIEIGTFRKRENALEIYTRVMPMIRRNYLDDAYDETDRTAKHTDIGGVE